MFAAGGDFSCEPESRKARLTELKQSYGLFTNTTQLGGVRMTAGLAARAAALLVATAAVGGASGVMGVAHADPSTIDEAESEQGERTCRELSDTITGVVAQDEQVFLGQVSSLQDFYGMSERDASTALGHIIRDDCPQFRPNIDAINASIGNDDD